MLCIHNIQEKRESENMKFSEQEINKIINLKGADGKLIDIFDLHGILFVGNSENGTWNLDKTYIRFSEHSLGIPLEEFEDCETEEDVDEQFSMALRRIILEKLI